MKLPELMNKAMYCVWGKIKLAYLSKTIFDAIESSLKQRIMLLFIRTRKRSETHPFAADEGLQEHKK